MAASRSGRSPPGASTGGHSRSVVVVPLASVNMRGSWHCRRSDLRIVGLKEEARSSSWPGCGNLILRARPGISVICRGRFVASACEPQQEDEGRKVVRHGQAVIVSGADPDMLVSSSSVAGLTQISAEITTSASPGAFISVTTHSPARPAMVVLVPISKGSDSTV